MAGRTIPAGRAMTEDTARHRLAHPAGSRTRARQTRAGHAHAGLVGQIQQPVPLAEGGAVAFVPTSGSFSPDRRWAATSSPESLAALRSSHAIRGTSQPSGFTPPAQCLARQIGQRAHPRVPEDTGGPLCSHSLPFAPSVFAMPCPNVHWTVIRALERDGGVLPNPDVRDTSVSGPDCHSQRS